MTPVLANEEELYFERGGMFQRITQRIAHRLGFDLTVRFRVLGFLLVTWFPLLLFALLEGRALGNSPKESLLLDFSTYVRFFAAVPLLILAELIVGPRLREAGRQFVLGGFVRPEEYPAFDQAIARVKRWRESHAAEWIILGLAVAGAWSFTAETVYGEGLATWRSSTIATEDGVRVSFTGLWYRLVSLPVLQFFWYRWLWRLILWAIFLWTVARLNLSLVATHADQAGGLGFLGTAHTALGIFGFALSAVLSAEAAFLIVFEKVDIESFRISYFLLLAFVEVFFLGPLLVFIPIMARTRLAWLRDYSFLVDRYNRSFHDKWIVGDASKNEPLLGSADIQSLADLGNSFEFIRGMKVVPVNLRVMILLAVMTSLPCLPLFLLVMPLGEILTLLTKAVV